MAAFGSVVAFSFPCTSTACRAVLAFPEPSQDLPQPARPVRVRQPDFLRSQCEIRQPRVIRELQPERVQVGCLPSS